MHSLLRSIAPVCHSRNPLSASINPFIAAAYAIALSPGLSIPCRCPIVIAVGQGRVKEEAFPPDVGVGGWEKKLLFDDCRLRREKPGLVLVVADSMERCRTGPGRECSGMVAGVQEERGDVESKMEASRKE